MEKGEKHSGKESFVMGAALQHNPAYFNLKI